MTLEDFLTHLKNSDPIALAMEALHRDFVHAVLDEDRYGTFLGQIKSDYPLADRIAIMGSGNWKYSLNPKKNFCEYNINSDIDVVVICRDSFERTWEELRSYHRFNFYLLSHEKRNQLKRNGENVYSGFISPKWIPGKSSLKFKYLSNVNRYANDVVGYRAVNLMYFKNLDETVDYYSRGFLLAQKRN